MLRQTVIYPSNGAEEIIAKRNRDGTYAVEMKTIMHYDGEPEPVLAVINMDRANVLVEALIGSDDKTFYTLTIPADEEPSELPQHQTTAEDWEMLGFRKSEASVLADEPTEED